MGLHLSEGAFKSSCSQPQKELRFPGIDTAAKYYETVYNYVCSVQKSLEFFGVCLKGMFLASILTSQSCFGLHITSSPCDSDCAAQHCAPFGRNRHLMKVSFILV